MRDYRNPSYAERLARTRQKQAEENRKKELREVKEAFWTLVALFCFVAYMYLKTTR